MSFSAHGSLESTAVRPDLLSASCPVPRTEYKEIVLAHGSGGKMTHRLIQQVVLPEFRNSHLETLHDGAILNLSGAKLAFTTDSYVVKPIFFPGGDIGSLAINGTVNDLAMCGAIPKFLSAAFIIEEGFAMEQFQRVVRSMRAAADLAGVELVTGDTKVVDRGKGDQIFVNTSGVGVIHPKANIHPARARVGDKILINGPVAVHGIAIMSVREGLEFETKIESDTAPLKGLVEAILNADHEVHVFRDPTRGGLASSLNEIAEQAGVCIRLEESAIPIGEEIKAACELLGFDPLYVANEGKLLAFVPSEDAQDVLATMRKQPTGTQAAIIGEVTEGSPSMVTMKTRIGGTRVVDMLSGEQLPRIC
jgi:hydrogenase expression/formation protein HypE